MAALAAAALLDELMGRNRNSNPDERPHKINWEDPLYCKYYLVKFCPHDLFVNTKADLGACQRIHDDEVKKLFEKAEPSYKKSYYQDEFLRFCQNMISDVERKILKGKQRLELMNDKSQHSGMSSQVRNLTDKITKLEAETEEAGLRGDVDQAQILMNMCDQLKEEREQLQKSENSTTAELVAAQEKQMEVCTVCGAFLIVGDAQQRIDDHLMGKQHVGYFRLKEAFDEISKERERQRSEKERRRREEHDREKDGKRGDRDRERERDRERRSARSDRDRDRDRERDRDKGDRDKDKERNDRGKDWNDWNNDGNDRDKDKNDRDKDKNDRDKDRGDRDKDRGDRDKDRGDRDRERNDRDKERSKSHRSSRDEKRSSKSRDSRDHDRKHRSDKDKNDRGGSRRDRSKDRSDRRRRSRSRGH